MLKSDRAWFFRKILIFWKMEGKGPQNRVFGLLYKIESLVSYGWLTCANPISGKILILEIYYMWKLSTNQIIWFFKLLYLLNHLTVFYNFLHKDRIPWEVFYFSPKKGKKEQQWAEHFDKINFFCILLTISSLDFLT